ncbi:DNA-binding MarR family transcriptional regulator [Desulfitispora alkaliphila]|uniref:MarR family winged helix-turn-helix transcriptional regulator n=1 Tax=Desulfitispora alkaliphila TaxID=622674 RepID=UPI003D1B4AA8
MQNISLGKWISILYRYGHIFINKELEPHNIGKGQVLFLIALYHKDGLPQEELSLSLNIDKGTTARAIRKLETTGYIIRKQNTKDLRSHQIFLTEKAKAFEPHLFTILNRWTEILSEGMTEEEVETALRLLTKMASNAAGYIQKERSLFSETTK